MGDTGNIDTLALQHVRQVIGRRLPLHRGVGGENDLDDFLVHNALVEHVQAEFLRPDAVYGRQVPHQHEIMPQESAALLYGQHIGRCFHHADHAAVAPGISAHLADLQFGEIAAAAAVVYALHRGLQGQRQRGGTLAVALQQVQAHALGRLGAHAGQAAQGLDQILQGGTEFHGCCRPLRRAASCRRAG